jgi:osmotically inducible protein OsmC
MPTRKASAVWEGGLQGGKGTFEGETGAVRGGYTAGSRFREEPGSNPEELLAAAHSACFSMAFAAQLERRGFPPAQIRTEAACTVEKVGEGFTITTMRLTTVGSVPGIDDATFQQVATSAKDTCPVSRALAGVRIEVQATLA